MMRRLSSYLGAGLLSLALFGAPPASACTLWAAAGQASLDGTLLAKNRDWRPDHQQSLRLVKPKNGYAFLGLYADDAQAGGIKAGVNQYGLSVVSAAASSLPRSARNGNPDLHGVIAELLRDFRSLDDIAARAQEIFPRVKPMFLLLADSKEIMQVEIGQGGRFAMQRKANGTLAHTNHYLAPELLQDQQHIANSSRLRLARINALLDPTGTKTDTGQARHTLAEFARLAQDRHDGRNNSLWRSGREYTLASWQIALPAHGAPHLHLLLANPDQAQQALDLKLDAAFWAQPAQTLPATQRLPHGG